MFPRCSLPSPNSLGTVQLIKCLTDAELEGRDNDRVSFHKGSKLESGNESDLFMLGLS